ncbi:MAG TPA: alpha/beta hydrolase [Nocardioides sp.]|uniref:alpha/beta hydrolase n=1 Tax=Nocardioides sp. TaxID=35761 RepID=UPI002E30C267|nr:alpha/beta hydrolase [Nocardioides sp.]HEX3931919.1 alpha/beta hydrolase [Nocardioides sp.]
MTDPSLTRHDSVAHPVASVLVLHGGKDRSRAEVTSRSLSWQRAAGLARTLGRRLHGSQVAVHLLRYRSVGWNDDGAEKVADTSWALDQTRGRLGELPVVLLGHSMGGRTACRSAGHAQVRGVVALAPWLPPDEPVAALAGKELHAAHGRRDRITRAADTRAFVERAAALAVAASFTDMGARGHYLLTGIHAWNGFAHDRVRRVLALS